MERLLLPVIKSWWRQKIRQIGEGKDEEIVAGFCEIEDFKGYKSGEIIGVESALVCCLAEVEAGPAGKSAAPCNAAHFWMLYP